MLIASYISKQAPDRQGLLVKIHEAIVESDQTVKAGVESVMGKEMIVYKANGFFKYGLASVKNYMSLHLMPIYGSPPLFSKYKKLLPEANFQKGCINFCKEDEIPLNILKELIRDCSEIDLLKIKEEYLKSRKK